MLRQFQQPFPFETSLRVKLIRAGLIGVFVGFFLTVFQPFGIQSWHTAYKSAKLLGFGVVSSALTAGHFLIWPWLFPHWFAENQWTVAKAIGFIVALLVSIAVANQLYLAVLLGDPVAAPDLVSSIIVTFLVGVFPTTVAVLASYTLRLRRYVQSANELSAQRAPELPTTKLLDEPPTSTLSSKFVLSSDNEKDTVSLTIDELLFIESSDNYATVVYMNQSGTARMLLRNTLSRLETQANSPDVVRCHRSFVVNLTQVERVTGNAQGYKLHLAGGQFVVPVARQYNATLIVKLNC